MIREAVEGVKVAKMQVWEDAYVEAMWNKGTSKHKEAPDTALQRSRCSTAAPTWWAVS